MYENNQPEDRLNATDAMFVDVIHTNGDKNGIFKSLGDIDFFPNGGKHQPNCGKSDNCKSTKKYDSITIFLVSMLYNIIV